MTISPQDNKVDSKYIIITGIAVLLSWIFHEFAHFFAGRLLGYDMAMSFNKSYPLSGQYSSDTDYLIVSVAGPILTLLEGIIIFFIMRYRKIYLLYPFLFTCFYMRLLATLISFLNPNDEARISKAIGWGTFTLPMAVTLFLFYLIYHISRQYRFDKKFNLINLGLVIFFSSIIILADQFYQLRIL